jgi:hypothetical protein
LIIGMLLASVGPRVHRHNVAEGKQLDYFDNWEEEYLKVGEEDGNEKAPTNPSSPSGRKTPTNKQAKVSRRETTWSFHLPSISGCPFGLMLA